MSEEEIKLLRELVRLVVDERQLLINHIKLAEPKTTEADMFLVGMRSALETLGKRVSLVLESIDKLEQRNIRADVQLKTIEDLVRPLHAFAYEVGPKLRDQEKNEPASGN